MLVRIVDDAIEEQEYRQYVSNLEGYELDEGDEELIDGTAFSGGESKNGPKPVGVLAVVGRPNVDTGGWEADVEGIESAIASQAQIAVQLADAVILVVDGLVGLTDTDERIVKMLRAAGKPVTLAVNKVDDRESEYLTAEFWKMGLGEPYGISAMHGRGIGELLDAALDSLKKAERTSGFLTPSHLRRVALVGRPNVGKSSLLNQLAHEERTVVNDLAGTTRDPVDEVVTVDGEDWLFIDTAGIKRRLHKLSGAEYFSSLRTQAAIERSELALVLFDASQPISDQDLKVMHLGSARQSVGKDRMAHHSFGQCHAWRLGIMGQAHPHRQTQRVPWQDPSCPPASAAWRQAAANPVRDAGVHQTAALRDLRHRLLGAWLSPLHRTVSARGIRLRRIADSDFREKKKRK